MICRVILASLLTLVLVACGGQATTDRALSFDFLMSGAESPRPVDYDEFLAPSDAADATNPFRGRLFLNTEQQNNHFDLQLDSLSLVTADRPGIEDLPRFDFEFVQSGELLIPTVRGPVINEHGWWEFVLSDGRVWDEPGDRGWSRAVIPFALKELREDCIHNGMLTFLYKEDGYVSTAFFQIVSQTCSYMKFEMSGRLEAAYIPGDVNGGDKLVTAAQRNRRSRLPVASIDTIAAWHPGADATSFGSPGEIAPGDMTAYGFVIDGVHFAGGCQTARGAYPYCDDMALPSYSTAKSVVGGLGLMLLENEYPGAAASVIADLVPECDDGWHDVTIEHALDMVTGHYESPEMHGDEDAAILGRFFLEDHAGKIDVACNTFPRKADPGTHLSYHTWDTYLVGIAMNNFLRGQRGADADFFDDLVVERLWRPLGLSELAANTRRTYDEQQQAYTGFGLTLLRDDVVKLAQFIGEQDGRIGDEPLLDRQMFDAIKGRIAEDPGIVAELPTIRYNNGFRSFDVSGYLTCEEPVPVVVLSGFGGIIIAIMPNDTAYYYFSDGDVHRYLTAVRESHKIRPMCN